MRAAAPERSLLRKAPTLEGHVRGGVHNMTLIALTLFRLAFYVSGGLVT